MPRRRVVGAGSTPRAARGRRIILGGRGYPGEDVWIEGNQYWPGDWGLPDYGLMSTSEAYAPPRVAGPDAPWGVPMIPPPQHPIDVPLTTLNKDYQV